MWVLLAFVSAALLGFYDTSKKYSLRGNDVIPVLFLNTLFCSAIFLPLILLSRTPVCLMVVSSMSGPAAGRCTVGSC